MKKSKVAKNVQFSGVGFKVRTVMSCRGFMGKMLRRVSACPMSMAKSGIITVTEEKWSA